MGDDFENMGETTCAYEAFQDRGSWEVLDDGEGVIEATLSSCGGGEMKRDVETAKAFWGEAVLGDGGDWTGSCAVGMGEGLSGYCGDVDVGVGSVVSGRGVGRGLWGVVLGLCLVGFLLEWRGMGEVQRGIIRVYRTRTRVRPHHVHARPCSPHPLQTEVVSALHAQVMLQQGEEWSGLVARSREGRVRESVRRCGDVLEVGVLEMMEGGVVMMGGVGEGYIGRMLADGIVLFTAATIVVSSRKDTIVTFIEDEKHVLEAYELAKRELPPHLVPSRSFMHGPIGEMFSMDAVMKPTVEDEKPETTLIRTLLSEISRMPVSAITGFTNIYEIGLDSISAIQLVWKLRRRGYTGVSVADVMNHPTAVALAKVLSVGSVRTTRLRWRGGSLWRLRRGFWEEGMIAESLADEGVNQCELESYGGWKKLVERHAILRTSFVFVEEEQKYRFLQVVRESGTCVGTTGTNIPEAVTWIRGLEGDVVKEFWAKHLDGVDPCLCFKGGDGCRRLGTTMGVIVGGVWGKMVGGVFGMVWSGRTNVEGPVGVEEVVAGVQGSPLMEVQKVMGLGVLFDTVLVFQKMPGGEKEGSLKVVRDVGLSKFAIMLEVIPEEKDDGAYLLRATVDEDVFGEEEALEILANFDKLLEEMVTQPASIPVTMLSSYTVKAKGTSQQQAAPLSLDRSLDGEVLFNTKRMIREAIAQVSQMATLWCSRCATATSAPSLTTALDMAVIEIKEFEEAMKPIVAKHFGSLERVSAILPCVPIQSAMIAQTLKDPKAYFNLFVYELEGNADVGRLRDAWMDVSTFAEKYDFMQVVMEDLEVVWTERSVRTDGEVEGVLADVFEEQVVGMKELQGSGLAFTVVSVASSGKIHFALNIHHALYDGWSLRILLDQVASRYNGMEVTFQPDSFSYMVTSILANLQEDGETSRREFWMNRLDSVEPSPFPDLSGTTDKTPGRLLKEQTLKMPLSDIEEQCRVLGVTVQAVSQATWALLLRSYLDTEDVVFGHVLSGRTVPAKDGYDLGRVVGPCLVTVPCRVREGDEVTNLEIVEGVLKQNLEVHAVQHVPLRDVNRWIGLRPGTALFDTIFLYQKTSIEDDESDKLPWKEIDGVNDVEYAIAVEFEPNASNELVARISAKRTVLSELQASLILRQLEALFNDILNNPKGSIGSLSTRISHDLTSILNADAAEIPKPAGICYMHSWVEHFASMNPTDVALEFASDDFVNTGKLTPELITYGDLNAYANKIAHRLREMGLKEGDNVPVAVDRSVAFYAAILGVSKAGGVYVPIETKVGAKFVVVAEGDKKAKEFVAAISTDIGIVYADTLRHQDAYEHNLGLNIDERVLFTSGSTGTPKGVLVEHYNLVQSMLAFQQLIPLVKSSHSSVRFVSYQGVQSPHIDLTPSVATLVRGMKFHRSNCSSAVERLLRTGFGGMGDGKSLVNAFGLRDAVGDRSAKPAILDDLSQMYLPASYTSILHSAESAGCVGPQPGYKTGDIGRFLADGTIEYLGRRDDQVKIRGMRLQLSEVNTVAASADESITSAYTLALANKVDGAASKQLVTFLVIKSDGDSSSSLLLDMTLSIEDVLRNTHPINVFEEASERSYNTIFDAETSRVSERHILKTTNIFELGIDSLTATHLARKLRNAGFSVQISEILLRPRVKDLLDFTIAQGAVSEALVSKPFEQEPFKEFTAKALAQVATLEGIQFQIEDIDKIYPCTPLQEGMIYTYLATNGGAYANQFELNVGSEIDITKLQEAWLSVINAHEILRTRFIAPSADEGSVNTKIELKKAINAHGKSATLLEPLRLSLYEAATGERILMLDIHHALYDGWTLPALLGDVRRAQELLDKALDSCTPALFPNITGLLPLSDSKDVIATRKLQVNARKLEDVAKELGVTAQTILVAAWSKILSNFVGESDVVFGQTLSGRLIPVDGIDEILGPCFNTIPGEDSMEAISFQHTPLSAINSWMGLGDSQSLFNTLFLYQKFSTESDDLSGTPELWKPASATIAALDYPVSIEVEHNESGSLVLTLGCKTNFVPADFVEVLAKQFDFELSGFVSNLNKPAAAIDISLEEEDLFAIENSNFENCEAGLGLLHRMFETSVQRSPDQVALEWVSDISASGEVKSTLFTYLELNTNANRLARAILAKLGHLRSTPEAPIVIPIHIPKSIELYIAILAVLKSGFPCGRCRSLLALTTKEYQGKFGPLCEVIAVDNPSSFVGFSGDNVDVEMSSSNLAYLLTTSGTTGTPKGVMIEHGNITQSVLSFYERIPFDFKPNSKFFQMANPSFDVSLYEMWIPWSLGKSICSSQPDLVLRDLEHAISSLGLTCIGLSPTLASLVRSDKAPSIELLLCGGEALTHRVLEEWGGSDGRLCNCYGPSECTVNALVNIQIDKNTHPSVIGRPQRTCSMYVMTENMTPALKGCIGELSIGGLQVARGYWNRPELTAAKFPTIQFEGVNDRVFMTGDLVRMLPDGSISFIGRKDDQVKRNGLRIELGEINATLSRAHEDIQDAVSMVLKHPGQQRDQIISFVSLSSSHPLSREENIRLTLVGKTGETEALQAALLKSVESLPSYMIPGMTFIVTRIPIGSTGKVDRKMLSFLYMKELQIRRVLSKIAQISEEIIARDISFFQLGLDSISAIRFSSSLSQMHINASVSEILRYPTIGQLGRFISGRKKDKSVFASPTTQERELYKSKVLASLNTSNELLGDIKAHHSYAAEIGRHRKGFGAWKEVVARNDILRTSFCAVETSFAQLIHSKCEIDVREFHGKIEDAIEQASNHIVLSDSKRPPIVFTKLQYEGIDYLIITLHHALYDGFSLSMMLDDAAAAYAGKLVARPPYQTLSEYITSQPEEESKVFWTQLLEGVEDCIFPNLTLPNAGSLKSSHGVEVEGTTSRKALDVVCRELGITMSSVTDIVFGNIVSGRSCPVPGIEEIMGPSFNTIPVRFDVSKFTSGVDLLLGVHGANMSSLEFQFTPLRSIIKWTRGSKLENRDLFDTLLSVLAPSDTTPSLNAPWSIVELDKMAELELSIYNTSPLHTSTSTGNVDDILFGCFPKRTSDASKRRKPKKSILEGIMRWFQSSPKDPTVVHEIVEKYAVLTPNALAIDIASPVEERWTFEQLNSHANKVAHYLLSKGLRPEQLVPICMDRTALAYATVLGILKAGGAYVPIDLEASAERKNMIISDVNAPLVICSQAVFSTMQVPDAKKSKFIIADSKNVQRSISNMKTHNPSLQINANNLAYCLYTSGTSGTPKGCLVEHGNCMAALSSFSKIMKAKSTARIFQFASLSFDVSVAELFVTWMAGGTVVSASRDEALSNLEAVFNKFRITHAALTPTLAALLRPDRVPSLQFLSCGGEKLTQTATIGVSLCPVSPDHRPSTLGKFFSTAIAYIVTPGSASLEILPRGAVVEVRKSATIEKHFWPAKVYRTGDLARMLEDGQIEFLGRFDKQVKFNGIRIELDEITTAVVASTPSITDGVTIVGRHGSQSRDQLVAFVTCSEMHELLQGQDSPWIIPIDSIPKTIANKVDEKSLQSFFESLSGELMQDLSLAYNELGSGSKLSDGIPESEWEAALQLTRKILSKASGVSEEQILPSSSIFHLGLDSISVVRISAELKDEGIRIDASQILQLQTLEQITARICKERLTPAVASTKLLAEAKVAILEEYVRTKLGNAASKGEVAKYLGLSEDSIESILPTSAGQTFTISSWINSNGEQFSSSFGFVSKTCLQSERLMTAMSRILEKNSIFRTAFMATPDENLPFIQIVLKSSENFWTYEEHQEVEFGSPDALKIVNRIAEGRKNFDLLRPPFHVNLVHFANNVSLFAVTMHHALYDGWSLRLLLKDIQDTYLNDGKARDDEDSATFADFLLFSCGLSGSEQQDFDIYSPHREYWINAVSNVDPSMFPSINRGEQAVVPAAGVRDTVLIADAITDFEPVRAFYKNQGVGIQSVFAAAWAKIQSQYVKSDTQVFGIYNAGRMNGADNAGFAGLNAPCMNVVPLVVQNSTGELVELSKEVQKSLIELQDAKSQVPLGKISAWAGLKGRPMFNVCFNFLNFPAMDGESDGLFEPLTLSSSNVPHPIINVNGDVKNINSNLDIAKRNTVSGSTKVDMDVEVAIEDGKVTIAISHLPAMLSRSQAQALIYEMCLIIVKGAKLWQAHGQHALETARVCLLHGTATGTETLKNLVLPGIGSFTLVDGKTVDGSDVGCNFFLEQDHIGKNRANIIETRPDFFKQFTVVITCNLAEAAVVKLSEICWQHGVPLVVVKTYGFVGYLRIAIPEHTVVETHPDQLVDLRLDCPFDELTAFSKSIKLEDLDSMKFNHVPYPIILLQCLEQWRSEHDGKIPQNYKEKNEFKELVNSKRRSASDDNENFDEAIASVHRACTTTTISKDVQTLLDDALATNLTAKSLNFWIIARAVRDFVNNEGKGKLPVVGAVPDMKSDTETYVQLQTLYRTKARENVNSVRTRVQGLLSSLDRSPDAIPLEEIERFCKNASLLQVFRYRSIKEEYEKTEMLSHDIARFLDDLDNHVVFYILLRAVDKFEEAYKKLPGAEGAFSEDLEVDIGHLKKTVASLCSKWQLNPSSISDDHIHETVRCGGAELPAMAGIMGGIVSQEVIKILTHQYIPLNNTLIYDGIRRPPPRLREHPKRSIMSKEQIEEARRLRTEDPDTWTVQQLARKYNTFPAFILRIAPMPQQRREFLERQKEDSFNKLSISKKQTLIDRMRRKALW
ncbi:hypothetical protein BC829DRAFT_447409 [Chytridium lagenaria]|nr:hypothetical protein BC829DRAFT_447409 [Chytridium lagenaria]